MVAYASRMEFLDVGFDVCDRPWVGELESPVRRQRRDGLAAHRERGPEPLAEAVRRAMMADLDEVG
jgi:hypothetical protein